MAAKPKRRRDPGLMVIVAYRPKRGKGAALLALARGHVAALRRLGLATARKECVMRAADGTVVEVFEWVSRAAVAAAHQHPAVAAIWAEYKEVCDYVPLRQLRETADLFAEFEPVHFE
jgi:quinol monooxygenase YgiN